MSELGPTFLREIDRRLFDESQARVHRCLDLLDERQVWWRPHEGCNSVGNLVLHLAGNIRQWVIATLGDQPDRRRRDAEFAERGPIPLDELRRCFNDTLDEARRVIGQLDPETLTEIKRVQGFDESIVAILIHVAEHASYHTGQITWITKMLSEADTGYYAGQNLDRTAGG